MKMPLFRERFRKLRGFETQAAFAKKVGISRPTVGFYENGERLPDAETISRLCESCAVSSDYLLGLTDDPTPASERSAVDDLGLSPEAVSALIRCRDNRKLINAAILLLTEEDDG